MFDRARGLGHRVRAEERDEIGARRVVDQPCHALDHARDERTATARPNGRPVIAHERPRCGPVLPVAQCPLQDERCVLRLHRVRESELVGAEDELLGRKVAERVQVPELFLWA